MIREERERARAAEARVESVAATFIGSVSAGRERGRIPADSYRRYALLVDESDPDLRECALELCDHLREAGRILHVDPVGRLDRPVALVEPAPTEMRRSGAALRVSGRSIAIRGG